MTDSAEVQRLQRENDVLRGIATKIMPCHYCGAEELAKCPHGFPGCSLADDLFPADEAQATWMADQRKALDDAREAVKDMGALIFRADLTQAEKEARCGEIARRIEPLNDQEPHGEK